METPNWIKIYSTTELYKAEMVKAILSESDISSFIFNKQDSSYGIFGEIDVLVLQDNVLRALHILKEVEI